MTAKEYLGQAFHLDQHINIKLQRIESLRTLTQKTTASYGGETVSHTRNVHSLQDVIVHLIEAEQDLNRQIDELIDLKTEIGKTIDKVRNETYRLILEKRYLCFMQWEQIAADMNYSRRWILEKHKRALMTVDKILAEKEGSA